MTPSKEKALAALLTHPTRKAASEAAGIDPRTMRRYLSDPEFQVAYKEAFSGLVVDATRQAQQALAPALSTLREIVEATDEDANARISAARAILSHGLKLTETTDILTRLDELEKSLRGDNAE